MCEAFQHKPYTMKQVLRDAKKAGPKLAPIIKWRMNQRWYKHIDRDGCEPIVECDMFDHFSDNGFAKRKPASESNSAIIEDNKPASDQTPSAMTDVSSSSSSSSSSAPADEVQNADSQDASKDEIPTPPADQSSDIEPPEDKKDGEAGKKKAGSTVDDAPPSVGTKRPRPASDSPEASPSKQQKLLQ